MAKMSVSEVEGEVDYNATMKEFGIDVMDPYQKKLQDAPAIYRRGLVFGQRDFARIFDAIKNKRRFAVLTGVNPSGASHLGNKLFIDQALYFQKCTKIFISTRTLRVYDLAVKISTKTTFSTVKAIFGFDNETNPGQIFYSVVQSAHILFPQLFGYKETVVPVGIDQDPYMRLVRDISEKMN